MKEAVLASFTLDLDSARKRLTGFEEPDWFSILWWLDISGMAIYFYHRACEIGGDRLLPREVEAGLAQRLSNNRARTKALLDEARALAAWFQRGNVPYSLLKGVPLTPHSVQESALRAQTGLDFLIADRFADLATHYVQRLGYRLHAQSANTLEFRAGAKAVPDLGNIYSVNTQRGLELHLAKDGSGECQLLSRRVMCEFGGHRFYALSSADSLVEQARHLVKHLCCEHVRLSWVLEFWRHLGSRRGDTEFWHRAKSCAAELAHGEEAVAMAIWLAENFFGGTRAEIPPQWRTDALPVRVRLWLEHYARTLLLGDTMGNKLCALLRKELLGSAQNHRITRQRLLPRFSPEKILDAQPNESHSQMWARYGAEARFIIQRLWSHFREGIRFAVEASRWNRTVARIGR
ncbi:MAG TPA: nucleotidyltransferase family protein [Terracidiphilus sp.]|nr:nucleotidyltransferase family protein [Terracidiphilus sp.]